MKKRILTAIMILSIVFGVVGFAAGCDGGTLGLNETTITLAPGETFQFEVEDLGDRQVTEWSVNNGNVFMHRTSGVATGAAVGTSQITATLDDETTLSATVNVVSNAGPAVHIDRNTNDFYGVMEFWGGAVDNGMSHMIAPLTQAMGFQTFRVSTHQQALVERDNNNNIRLRRNANGGPHQNVTNLRNQVAELQRAGVRNIIGMNHYNLQPAVFERNRGGAVFPHPTLDASYLPFMQMIEDTFYVLSRAFPEILYWQSHNEINVGSRFIHGGIDPATNQRLYFDDNERQIINTDLMFFAQRGVRRGNPNARHVMPGHIFNGPATGAPQNASPGLPGFIRGIYERIASGNYPSVGGVTSTNPRDFFDYLSWHPYEFGSISNPFRNRNNQIFAVMEEFGDGDAPVIFTEFGLTTTDVQFRNMTVAYRENLERQHEHNLVNNIIYVKDNMPNVVSVVTFRLFDWEGAEYLYVNNPGATAIEIGFGLFTSRLAQHGSDLNPRGVAPKPHALRLFHHINGEDAPIASLLTFASTDWDIRT